MNPRERLLGSNFGFQIQVRRELVIWELAHPGRSFFCSLVGVLLGLQRRLPPPPPTVFPQLRIIFGAGLTPVFPHLPPGHGVEAQSWFGGPYGEHLLCSLGVWKLTVPVHSGGSGKMIHHHHHHHHYRRGSLFILLFPKHSWSPWPCSPELLGRGY